MMSSLSVTRVVWGAVLRPILPLALLFVGVASAQNDSPLNGIVSDVSGNPIAGVSVLGGKTKECCPIEYDHTITNERGEFQLRHPGTVIRLFSEKFEPLTLVVQLGASPLKMTLLPLGNDLNVPACGRKKSGTKRIGWLSVVFDVPHRDVQISGGKPDTDYVVYTIKPKSGDSHLQFWFGLYAINTDPDDQDFVDSVSFSQRCIVEQGRGVVGIDSSGKKRSGERWRQTVVAGGGGARYLANNEKDAELFDRIVDSICFVPPLQ